MDTKKLIGTIVGVVAFAALIAGATFAWLTANATVTNSVFTGVSKNFIISYNGSASVSGFNQIVSGSATTAAITSAASAGVADDAWAAVTASKAVTDPPLSSFKVKLAITGNTFSSNAIIWALCKGNCPTGVALATVSSGNVTCGSGVTNCGAVPGGSLTEIEMYNDTTTFRSEASSGSGTTSATYNVYFWIDSKTLTNTDAQNGASFAGYIHAEATQTG